MAPLHASQAHGARIPPVHWMMLSEHTGTAGVVESVNAAVYAVGDILNMNMRRAGVRRQERRIGARGH
jgi:hypothetical protein